MKPTEAESRSRAVVAELRKRRNEAGLSQRQIAERIGVDHNVIRRVEASRYGRVKIDILMDYAAALGFTLDFNIKSIDEQASNYAPLSP